MKIAAYVRVSTDDWEHEIAIRLMGDCGLRHAEVLDVCPAHISRYTDGRHYRLEVVGGEGYAR